MSNDNSTPLPTFKELSLSEPVLKALDTVGYETPTPIQAQIIPHVLEGRDVLGLAQTGTGKTAAFALPILSNIDIKKTTPQVLVLAPTRELAIQVAEAFHQYASGLKGFHVLPIYGGQDYSGQIRQLKRGVHVVVGTPGRVMDHMRKGTLKLDGLKTLVLDEADEMLRMGFIDDVEWVLEQIPEQRQIALCSATMPKVIRTIAKKYLNDPQEITIKMKTATAETINQRYWLVSGLHKLDALTRILEAEEFDGILIFVRTKTATVELAEKLEARGYATMALNGDIQQSQRERIVNQFKNGKMDILVATDVAARGLDVQRISHVINYDIPYDTEAYVHRIGRTGRAGRSGEAILFVAPRERRMLSAIERATKKRIEIMDLPSTELINDNRVSRFKQKITDAIGAETSDLAFFHQLIEQYQQEHNIPAIEIAGALAKLLQGDNPLLLTHEPKRKESRRDRDRSRNERDERGSRRRDSEKRGEHRKGKDSDTRQKKSDKPKEDSELFRLEVGKNDGAEIRNIVGAIANETGLEGEHIQKVTLYDDYSTVVLPEGMPRDLFRNLKKIWVSGKQLNISRLGEKKPKQDKAKSDQPRKSSAKPKKSRRRKNQES